jgi:hypothetical protein
MAIIVSVKTTNHYILLLFWVEIVELDPSVPDLASPIIFVLGSVMASSLDAFV